MTVISDIEAIRGDGETYLLTMTEDDEPLNLTDADMWMTAKRHIRDADADAIFQKTVGDGITITNAEGGLATVELVPADTSELASRTVRLVYDVQVKLASGRIVTPLKGRLTVEPDVTVSIA
jgi:hypothetical protein